MPGIDPTQDPDFIAASPQDQSAYLSHVDPDFAKAAPADQTAYLAHVMSSVPQSKYLTEEGSGVQSFPKGSQAESDFLKQNPKATPLPGVPTSTGTPAAQMQTSALPQIVRGTTAALPAAGSMAGAAAASPTIAGAVGGAGLGAAAGTEAEQLINRAAFGKDEVSPVSAEGLKEAGENAVTSGATAGVMQGASNAVESALAAKTAAKAATEDAASLAAQRAATAKAATSVVNKASDASDSGIVVDAGKSISALLSKKGAIGKLGSGAVDEFMEEVQPVLSKVQKDMGIENITKMDPRDVLKYRDAVADALFDSKYSTYQQPIVNAISKDLRTAVPELSSADKKIPMGIKVLQVASKLGNAADDAVPAAVNAVKSAPAQSATPASQATASIPKQLAQKWSALPAWKKYAITAGAGTVGVPAAGRIGRLLTLLGNAAGTTPP
jgi:hypothetical protein